MSQLGLDMATAEDRPPRPGGGRGAMAVVMAVLVVLALLAGVVVAASRLLGSSANDDYPGPGSGPVTVVIAPGASLTEIGETLVDAGVVRTTDAFLEAAAANPDAVAIQPGTYELLSQMAADDAVAALLDPETRLTARVTVPEGLRVSATVDVLVEESTLRRKDLRAALRDPAGLGLPDYAGGEPEGFLFPATYELQPTTTAEQQLQAMVARFDQAAAEVSLTERAPDVGLSPYEVVIVASLLEAEGRPKDFAKISRVIQNRLELGMPLQLDATVNYALGISDLTLDSEQLEVDSPYNTYRYTGLPPGPINSPGEAALEAALAPARGPWIYYVTVNPETGRTKFTDSYEEFLQFKAEFKARVQASQ